MNTSRHPYLVDFGADADDDDDGYSDTNEALKGSDRLLASSIPGRCNGADDDGDTLVDEPPIGAMWDTNADTVADCLDPNVDTDLDGIMNPSDTDDDGDGFSDTAEQFMSTDELAKCNSAAGQDADPLDNDHNGARNVTDVLKYKGRMPSSGTTMPKSPLYDRRLDLTADGMLNVNDILKFKGKTPSSCS